VIRVGAKEIEAARQEGIKRDEGALMIADVSSHYLELLMSRAMCFQRFDKRTEQWVTRDPPSKWALALQAAVEEWRFPALNGLVTAPSLRADGSLVQAPGYDRQSGIWPGQAVTVGRAAHAPCCATWRGCSVSSARLAVIWQTATSADASGCRCFERRWVD
jgi:hypothetical protein